MTKKVGSTGRFGARYGKKVRRKVLDVEKVQRGWHQCPYCSYNRTKRIASGIWHCKKCDSKFTGRAYTVK